MEMLEELKSKVREILKAKQADEGMIQISVSDTGLGIAEKDITKIFDEFYRVDNEENQKVSDMGWELYPEAIYYVLMDLKLYNKPIYITENGLADAKDQKRGWFIFETLKCVHRAIEQGADVKGYLYWSLMDNVELDKGFWPRFGLLEIDRETLERKIRPSANFYRDVCLANGITADIVSKYQNLLVL